MYRIACLRILKSQIDAYQKHDSKLVRKLISCSPKVTAYLPGLFLLDASGLKHLGGEEIFCRNVLKTASTAGFSEACVGIADSAFTAIVASKARNKHFYIVEPKGDADFLAPLSIRHLRLSPDMEEALLELGIKAMGQLTRLPLDQLSKRFGQEALSAYKLACGKDDRLPQTPPVEKQFSCAIELALPIETLPQASFIIKSMIDRLVSEITQEDFVAEEILVSLYSNNDKFDERTIPLIRPSNNAKFLLEVVRLSFEAKPFQRECTGIALAISKFRKEDWEQLNCHSKEHPLHFCHPEERPNFCHPEPFDSAQGKLREGPLMKAHELAINTKLMILIQRFLTRLGEEALVRPQASDQYVREKSADWVPILDNSRNCLVPNKTYVQEKTAACGDITQLVLKRSLEPFPVLIELRDSQPIAVSYQHKWYHIKHITIPDCLSGLWWDKPVCKSYYMAVLEPRHKLSIHKVVTPIIAMLVHDHKKDTWFIEGIFD